MPVLPNASIRRTISTAIIHIPKTNVFRFGDPTTARPVLRDLAWTVNEDEAWAVIGSGSGEKSVLFETLLGHTRLTPPPPPPGMFPALSASGSFQNTDISLVAFGHRPGSAGGGFYDYSARYGAVRDEDRVTLRQKMFPETIPRERFAVEEDGVQLFLHDDTNAISRQPSTQDLARFDDLVEQVGLRDFLDLPMVALSNGQTRRARILRAILRKPQLLLLDEPLTGLDVNTRPSLLNLLRSLHEARAPRLLIGLRSQDAVPDWITHIASVHNGRVITGPKDTVLKDHPKHSLSVAHKDPVSPRKEPGQLLVDLRNVTVKYSDRLVLNQLNWSIRQGERWHLQGANGSGKTTLLSLLTGDHPQSYTQRGPSSHLELFQKPRSKFPTAYLQSLIGVVSPELFDAFPRRQMTVWEVIGTGFDGGFVSKGKEGVGIGTGFEKEGLTEDGIQWRLSRVNEVLDKLGPWAWHRAWQAIRKEEGDSSLDPPPQPPMIEEYKNRAFADLSIGEQRMVLLMRALVGKPPLVFLDEVWSGMDAGMVRAARKYLISGDAIGDEQAIVVITHWEEEVPWSMEDGLQTYRLTAGKGEAS